jgi:hypothetical protein
MPLKQLQDISLHQQTLTYKNSNYILKQVDNDSSNEMQDFVCLLPQHSKSQLPQPTVFKMTAIPFSNIYQVGVQENEMLASQLTDAGKRARDELIADRSHPKNMKLQSLPFGFNTSIHSSFKITIFNRW